MQRRTFLTALAALSAPPLARADCMPLDYEARYVTRPAAQVPPDGGVLVALMSAERPRRAGDPLAGTFSLVEGARRTRLTTTSLGPGLLRVDVSRRATGRFSIEGPIGALELTRGPELPPLEQPAIRGVFLPPPSAPGAGPTPSVTLVRPVPTGTVAAVLRRHVGARPTPTLLGHVRTGTLGITLNEVARCAPPLPGALVPSIGARVDLVYVDAFGRVSSPSGVVTFGG